MLSNVLAVEQRQILSNQQIQSLEVLAYSNQELDNFLVKEYSENPMLETSANKEDSMIKSLEEMYERNNTYYGHYMLPNDEDYSRRNDIPAPIENELFNYILSQLHEPDFTVAEWQIFNYLINFLNEDGFFTHETSAIAETLGCSVDIIDNCLGILKTLDPIGIFSKDISECLKIQLENLCVDDEDIFTVIDKYLLDILKGQISTVSRGLKLSTAKVREYMHFIGKLNPKPIMPFFSSEAEYIVPESDRWHIKLNDSWIGEYKFSDYYIHMMQKTNDDELKAYFKMKLERARHIIQCVEQRRNTIVRVVETILEIQDDYFSNGGELRPMSLEDIAKQTQLHASTISRAIKDKYMQYKKTILLKDLFVTAMNNSDDKVSNETLKKLLKEIVANENKEKPLSDIKIADEIKNQGFDISRRTVTKYRQLLGIPESRQRLYLK